MGTYGDEDPPQEEFDWETYEAYATFFRGMKMNKATWTSLSREAQQAWDNIPQKDKNIILLSRAGMSPRNPSNTPQAAPPNAQPSPPPSALRSPSHQRQVDFHEIPDRVPSIDDQYQTNFLERVSPVYDVNRAVQNASDTAIALSNNTFYTPKPSEHLQCHHYSVKSYYA